MRCSRKRSAVAALLALCAALAIAATLAGCGDDPAASASGAGESSGGAKSASATESSEKPKAADPELPSVKPDQIKVHRVLALATVGTPVVWVKRGESVVLRTSPGGKPIKRLQAKTEFGSPSVFSVQRRQGYWAGVSTPLLPNGTLAWLKLNADKLHSGAVHTAIDIDLSDRVASFKRDGKLVDRFPVSIGAPSSPTPTGTYSITDTFRGNLNIAYGCCAVALSAHQVNLPSGWLGGNRIAIHGTYGALGEAISHGCIRAPNESVNRLVNQADLGTPVHIHG